MQSKKKIKIHDKNKMNFFVKTAVAVFIAFSLITIVKLQIDYNNLVEKKSECERRIDEMEDEIDQLSDELARPFNDDYVRDVARDKLNYRMPGEIIFYNDMIK